MSSLRNFAASHPRVVLVVICVVIIVAAIAFIIHWARAVQSMRRGE